MFNMHEKRWLVLLRSAIFKKYLEELTLTLRQQMINLALMLFGGIQTNSKDLIHLFLLPQDFLLLLYIQLVFYRIQLKTRLQTNKQTWIKQLKTYFLEKVEQAILFSLRSLNLPELVQTCKIWPYLAMQILFNLALSRQIQSCSLYSYSCLNLFYLILSNLV